MANAALSGIRQQLPHHVKLVVAGENLLALLLAGLFVLLLHHLGVVLENVGEALRGEDALPQVVGLEAGGVGRIAGAVVPALVEGQKPRNLALQVGTHPDFVVIHREVDHAAAKLEDQLARVAVAPILLDGVLDGLLGQAVLELESGDGQAVDEQGQIERELGLVAAVAQLAGDAEAVGGEALGGLGVAGRRGAVEEVQAWGRA